MIVLLGCSGSELGGLREPAGRSPANLRTKILDFGGFDSSRILILRGGIPRPKGNCLESLSQGILVGIILVGRLGAQEQRGGGSGKGPRSPRRGSVAVERGSGSRHRALQAFCPAWRPARAGKSQSGRNRVGLFSLAVCICLVGADRFPVLCRLLLRHRLIRYHRSNGFHH